MASGVQRRRYESAIRRESAEQTRRSIRDAARQLFIEHGYAATSMADIAESADVAVDTIYAAIGPKPRLFGELMSEALDRESKHVGAEKTDRTDSDNIPATSRSYAKSVGRLLKDLAPLVSALRAADPVSNWLYGRARRLEGQPSGLASRYLDRSGVDLAPIADEIWALSSIEVYLLLVGARGWSHKRYEEWLETAISRLLHAEKADEKSD